MTWLSQDRLLISGHHKSHNLAGSFHKNRGLPGGCHKASGRCSGEMYASDTEYPLEQVVVLSKLFFINNFVKRAIDLL